MIEAPREFTIPWEKRKEIGLLKALWQTTRGVLFHPKRFFDQLIGVDSFSGAFSFYIAILITTFLLQIALSALTNFSEFKLFLSASSPSLVFILILALIPITMGVFIMAAIMHLFVALFRGKGGYAGTFNVFAYSCVTELWLIFVATLAGSLINLFLSQAGFLPANVKSVIGIILLFSVPVILLAGLLWMALVLVVGYMRVHKMGVLRAMSAFLFPVVLFGAIQYAVNKKEKENTMQHAVEGDTLESIAGSLERVKRREITGHEDMARSGIMMITAACRRYLKAEGKYPSSLKDLANATTFYILPSIARATAPFAADNGYYYVYESLDKDHFTLFARPAERNVPGGKIFFMDQSEVLRSDGPSGPPDEAEKESSAPEAIKAKI